MSRARARADVDADLGGLTCSQAEALGRTPCATRSEETVSQHGPGWPGGPAAITAQAPRLHTRDRDPLTPRCRLLWSLPHWTVRPPGWARRSYGQREGAGAQGAAPGPPPSARPAVP